MKKKRNWLSKISAEINNVAWCIVRTKNPQGRIKDFQLNGAC